MSRGTRAPVQSTSLCVGPVRNGQGLIAMRRFAPRSKVTRIPGRVVHWTVLWRRSRQFASNCIRYGPETYLDPGGGPARYANHSCDPNAALGKDSHGLFLFAVRTIRPGDEVVFDYSTTIGDDDIWRMKCNCGAPHCRGWVGRFGLLPERVRRSHLRRGLVPRFIVATLSER